MQKKWKVKSRKGDFSSEFLKKYHLVVLELLWEREIRTKEEIESYFNFDYGKVCDPFLFADMEKAVERISQAKEKKEKIAIFGDYDADGVMASALMRETLKNLGFADPVSYIPDRQLEGYGMNLEAVNYLAKEGVTLTITVDCGITNIKEVEEAKKLGMDVVVTDHHHVPKEIPKAVAIINPNAEKSEKIFKDLAGVGVAFKLAQALYKKLDPENIEQLKWALDLVAIGTVADCVSLLGENRILVKYGLVVLSKTRRAGFLEMFKVGRILINENEIPDTQKIAFQISPRINAAGRMDHASAAYNLVIENDQSKANILALEIESKNQERQKITAEIVREIRIIAESSFKDKKFIFVESPHWPVGILGLVAGRMAEEFNKPIAVLQKQEGMLVGSFRSIPQVNIIEKIEECSELLEKFGGHSQAAGVSVKYENAEKFYEKISKLIEKELENKDVVPEIEIDAEIKPEEINWDLIMEIKKMEPFGEGNEGPVFLLKEMVVEDFKIVGNGSKHLKVFLRGKNGNPKVFDGIGFGFGEKFQDLQKGEIIDAVFNIREDEWNGNKKIQLRLVDIRRNKIDINVV